jgi:type IV pilus assembly protein PilE
LNNSITTTKSLGFSLIELLVVVAILGVISAIGTVSYNGYVSTTERKSAENLMRQVSLGQTEFYSENGIYFSNSNCGATTPTVAHSKEIETRLLGDSKSIIDSNKNKANAGYLICVKDDNNLKYIVYAIEKEDDKSPAGDCKLSLDGNGSLIRDPNC